MYRVWIRPTNDGKYFSLIVFGRQVPYDALLTNHEALKQFVKKVTNRDELKFGNIRWSSEWR